MPDAKKTTRPNGQRTANTDGDPRKTCLSSRAADLSLDGVIALQHEGRREFVARTIGNTWATGRLVAVGGNATELPQRTHACHSLRAL